MQRLLNVANEAAVSVDQPTLYAKAHTSSANISREGDLANNTLDTAFGFHVSIGWSLRKPPEDTMHRLCDIMSPKQTLKIVISKIKIKVGNSIQVVDLLEKQSGDGGIVST